MSLTKTTAVYILIVLTAIYVIFITPLVAYFTLKMWHLDQLKIPFIRKRHPKLVICNVILINTYIIVVRPILDFSQLDQDYQYLETAIWKEVLYQTAQFMFVFTCVRLWLLYYDYTSALQHLNEKWQTQITQTTKAAWTSKHRWLGNPKTVTMIGCIFTTTVILMMVVLPRYVEYIQTVAILYILFILIMMIKIHKCRDEFSIRKEFWVTMIWIVLCAVIYYSLIYPFVDPDSFLRIVLMNAFISAGCYSLCFISTQWVIKQHHKDEEQNTQTRASSAQSGEFEKSKTLERILQKDDGFDLFANHLVKEFALENLAFLFEVMQMKSDAINSKLVTKENAGSVMMIPAQRLKKVRRKNSNVYGVNELREGIEHITKQYIYDNAEYSINVSSKTRKMLITDFNELGKQEIVDNVADIVDRNLALFTGTETVKEEDKELTIKYVILFDKAVDEISGLLTSDSLGRFQRSKEYKTMITKGV